MPSETPEYGAQAQAMKDLLERLSVKEANVVGAGWGGQVAIELALAWPNAVKSLVLISSTYSGEQVGRLRNLSKPTLIVYAEDDMVTQLKAGYLLRDAIGTSRLEVSHKLERFKAPQVLQLVRLFLSRPEGMVSKPLETENALRGLSMKVGSGEGEDPRPSAKP